MKRTICLVLLLATGSLLAQAEKPVPLLTIPNAKYLYCLSASPRERTLFLVVSKDKNQGEANEGVPKIVHFPESGSPVIESVKGLTTAWVYDPMEIPVWSSDGKIVYFDSEAGVVSYNLANSRVETVWKGNANGLAISPNGKYLAFWSESLKNRNQLTLILFDLQYKKVKQTWPVELQYGGDLEGFDIAFAPNSQSVYARTFDEEVGGSPLKRFKIGSATPGLVAANITGLASGKNAVYFVTEALENDTLRYTFMAISDAQDRSVSLKDNLPCRALEVSGSHRWITCRDDGLGEAKFLFDSEKQTFVPISTRHENLVVMYNGDVVYTAIGDLFAASVVR